MIKILKCSVYPFDVLICIEESHENVCKKLTELGIKYKPKHLIMNGTGRTNPLSNGAVCIQLKEFPNDPFTKSVLAHEVFHATEYLMEYIGISHDGSSSEAWAYYIGWLTEEIYKTIEIYESRK